MIVICIGRGKDSKMTHCHSIYLIAPRPSLPRVVDAGQGHAGFHRKSNCVDPDTSLLSQDLFATFVSTAIARLRTRTQLSVDDTGPWGTHLDRATRVADVPHNLHA